METAYPNPSRVLPLDFKINRQAQIRFNITVDDASPTTTGWTWQLFIKRFPGDRKNIISLTLGNGLSYEIYSDTILVARFTSAQLAIEEGVYYWELVRTDIENSWLEGPATFTFAKSLTDSNLFSDVEINVDSTGTPITISLTTAGAVTVDGVDHDRGTFDASPGLFPQTNGSGTSGARSQFDRYIISTAGTIAGLYCAVGTIIMALRDAPTDDWDTTTGWRQI